MEKTINENRPFISIIIPVYNVEEYLVRCLHSIFSQQVIGEFEVITVDDGSTDNSLNILKEYKEKESRLHVIEHGCNKRLSVARTTGMKAAVGNYIMHVDSDDWLLPGALAILYKKIKNDNADVIVFNYQTEDSKGRRKYIRKIAKDFFTTNKVEIQKHFTGAVWNKIVKNNLVENMVYMNKSINHAEDLIYATEILIRAKKFSFIKDYIYVYYINLKSLTRTTTILSEYLTLTNITLELECLLNKYNNQQLTKPIFDLRFKYSLNFAIRNYFLRKNEITFDDLVLALNKLDPSNRLRNDLNKLFNRPSYFLYLFLQGHVSFRHFLIFVRRCLKVYDFRNIFDTIN